MKNKPQGEKMPRLRALTVLAVTGLLALSACSGGSKTGTAGITPPNIAKLASLGPGEGKVNIVA
jgi:putative spermidine/putrescine transport system substrate-binding protein